MTDRIEVSCPECASVLRAPGNAIGKKIRCPMCQTIIAVQALEAPKTRMSSSSGAKSSAAPRIDKPAKAAGNSASSTSPRSAQKAAAKPKRRVVEEPEEDPNDPWGSGLDDWNSYDDPPVEEQVRLPPKTKKKTPERSRPALRGSGNEPPPMVKTPTQRNMGAVFTGILMMAGAAVWFFGGLAAGYIFFYPPVLFLVGIGTVVKGLMGSE
jgi:hypothetical protein